MWELSGAALVTSSYAAQEAQCNLDRLNQREDLVKLLSSASVSDAGVDLEEHPGLGQMNLPEGNLPILRAAVAAGATYLERLAQ